MPKNRIRHGDVFLFAVTKLPKGLKKKDNRVVALGEVTGHRHELEDCDVFIDTEGRVYAVPTGSKPMIHHLTEANTTTGEHPSIALQPDTTYEVVIQTEYTPEGWKQVQD